MSHRSVITVPPYSPRAVAFGVCSALACRRTCIHGSNRSERMRNSLFWLKMPSVSKTAANASPQTEKPTHYTWVKLLQRNNKIVRCWKCSFERAPLLACISSIPQLLCVRLKTWCFSWLCDYLTLHSRQRLYAKDICVNTGNSRILNHQTG